MIDFLARAFGGGTAQKPQSSKRINLALQGGGAHGAFTWGVLDHLLEDGRLTVEGISGTSAGAVNAVMLADGLRRGGPQEARKRLADFWRAASLGGDLPAVQRAVINRLFSLLPEPSSPTLDWLTAWSRYLSPYDVNPLNINPLKELIERFVDFEGLRADPRALFVAATNVQTGQLHVFPPEKISAEAVMALGLPAGGVSRGGNRRRSLLGRRLSRQSGALPVLPRDANRGPADRADQSARAPQAADLDTRDHVARQRDHLQRAADGRIARHRVHQPADRVRATAARHRRRTNTAASTFTASCSRAWASASPTPPSCATTTNCSSCCASSASARRVAFLTRISPISASAAASTWPLRYMRRRGSVSRMRCSTERSAVKHR